MDFGVHLPLLGLNAEPFTLTRLQAFVVESERVGFRAVSANDHFVFSRPWLDGLVALSSILGSTQSMTLATTVSLPVIRGPVALAKALAAIDLLSGGRLTVGVGPGSSQLDYQTVGVPFEERWQRLEDAIRALRAYWRGETDMSDGKFYPVKGVNLEPRPVNQSGPPIWIGSWGSTAGLRRTARLGDGWLASAYNTTPEKFGAAWNDLKLMLADEGKDATTFPNALATMWCYITEDKKRADEVLTNVLIPMIKRPKSEIRGLVLVGNYEECGALLRAYQAAGVQRVLIWPLADELDQLKVLWDHVVPLL